MFLTSVAGDKDLTAAFSNLKPTGIDSVDVEVMMHHMLSKASPYDGKYSLMKLQQKPTARGAMVKIAERYKDNYGDDDDIDPMEVYMYLLIKQIELLEQDLDDYHIMCIQSLMGKTRQR